MTKDTIDERINQIVYQKGITADAIVDGGNVKITPAMVDFLIS